MAVGAQLIGDKKLIRALERLGGAAQRRVVRPGVTKALSPITGAAKKNVTAQGAKRTGLLRKSIRAVVRTYRGSGIIWGGVGINPAIVGVDERGRTAWPIMYAHLVERGTYRTRAKPFLRPAFDANKGRALRILEATVRTNLEKEVRRAARK